jgi:hypothetical protein
LKKCAIERGIVGYKLSNPVRISVSGKHGDSRMPTQKFREGSRDFFGIKRFPSPEAAAVVILSKTIAACFALIKANLCLKRLDGLKVVTDGNRGELDDRMPLRV